MAVEWRRYHIHVADELPAIGSGMRLVYAAVGRKWVRVKWPSDPVTRQKVRREVWDGLLKVADDRTQSLAWVLDAMRQQRAARRKGKRDATGR